MRKQDVDARHEAGHDVEWSAQIPRQSYNCFATDAVVYFYDATPAPSRRVVTTAAS